MAFGVDDAISIGTSLFDSVFGHYEGVRDQHFQADEAQKQRSWTSLENKKNREWQEQMYNLYNSPSAMKRQYEEANYNPYLMMAQNNIGNGMSASPPSSGGGAHASGGVVPGSHLGSNYIQSLGVQADAANQHARTIQQNWETYQFIRQHVGSDAAKRFLDSHPEMFQSNDPDNDPWMRAYKRSELRENISNDVSSWEYALKQLYGVKQAELEMNFVRQKTDDLVSQISKRDAEEKEIMKTVGLIDEKIKTEKSVQSRNYSEGSLASAKAKTENQSRKYIVQMLLDKTGILDHLSETDLAHFESEDALRGWLRSVEGRTAIRDAARASGMINSDLFYKAIWSLLGNVGANVSIHGSQGTSETSTW